MLLGTPYDYDRCRGYFPSLCSAVSSQLVVTTECFELFRLIKGQSTPYVRYQPPEGSCASYSHRAERHFLTRMNQERGLSSQSLATFIAVVRRTEPGVDSGMNTRSVRMECSKIWNSFRFISVLIGVRNNRSGDLSHLRLIEHNMICITATVNIRPTSNSTTHLTICTTSARTSYIIGFSKDESLSTRETAKSLSPITPYHIAPGPRPENSPCQCKNFKRIMCFYGLHMVRQKGCRGVMNRNDFIGDY